ncbi:hypothetical protein AB0D14_33250 [Streptomyces sp. NPDC048484]|uniref:hypothetical protein n=1 Tax=Streptomyces sp. NPDC048484 TaxID=3155146 RepID=UPI0034204453
MTRQLAIPFSAPAGLVRAVIVGREGEDFTDRDRCFARRIQPLPVRTDSHVRELERLRASLSMAYPGSAPLARAGEYAITPRELTVLGPMSSARTASPA